MGLEYDCIFEFLIDIVRRLIVLKRGRASGQSIQYEQDAIWNIFVYVHTHARKAKINRVINEQFLKEKVFMDYWKVLEQEYELLQ